MIRYDVHFEGRVQGVGFRYTACRLARDFTVAGYVRNLPDGRVRMVAEGSEAQLEGLVAAIQERMRRNITDTRIDRQPANGELGDPQPGGLEVMY